jgi:uncharacterized protein YbjT (DUF2867 family)
MQMVGGTGFVGSHILQLLIDDEYGPVINFVP